MNPFSLRESAWRMVHIDHVTFVLRAMLPSTDERLLVGGYAAILLTLHARRIAADGEFLAEVRAATTPGLFNVVRGIGVWMTTPYLEEISLSPAALKSLPAFSSPIEVDQARSSGTLPGFKPLRPINAGAVLGPYAGRSDGTVPARRARRPGEAGPLDMRSRPSNALVTEAWTILEHEFPGISRDYLSTLIIMAFKAQQADGPAPMLVVTGDTGSGKGGTQHVAAAMLGGVAASVRLTGAAKDFARSLGLALSQDGACLTYVDEVGRSAGVYASLEPLLAIHRTFRFDVKYGNEREIAVTAPVSLIGSTLPKAITGSPEMARRCVGIQLDGHSRKWAGPFGRVHEEPRLRGAAQAVVADLWWLVKGLGPMFDWKVEAMGRFGGVPLAHLDLFDPDEQAPFIRRLYHHFMTAPERRFSKVKPGWLDVRHEDGELWGILDELIVFEDERKPQHGRIQDLKQLDLAPILGFAEPALRLLIFRKSGRHVRIKFTPKGLRGQGPPKETWPLLEERQVEADRVRLRPARHPGRLHLVTSDGADGDV